MVSLFGEPAPVVEMVKPFVLRKIWRFLTSSPLLPSALHREKRLSNVPMTSRDVCRMMQRRLARAGLPMNLSPHSFRVAGITDLLGQKIELGDVQTLAGHADPRTTRLYDRSERKVTRNLVERIKIGR